MFVQISAFHTHIHYLLTISQFSCGDCVQQVYNYVYHLYLNYFTHALIIIYDHSYTLIFEFNLLIFWEVDMIIPFGIYFFWCAFAVESVSISGSLERVLDVWFQ